MPKSFVRQGTQWLQIAPSKEEYDAFVAGLASQSAGKGANLIGLQDSNTLFIATTVEDALREIAEPYRVYKSNKDSNGVFTTVEIRRKATGVLYQRSVLSGGTSPNYTTRTVTWFASNGSTVTKTQTYTLSYDADGDLISEV